MRRGDLLVWTDEFSVHLLGRVVRVWGPIGETVRQRLDVHWDCASLALAVDPITGQLDWHWLSRGIRDRRQRARAPRPRDRQTPPELMHWLERLAQVGVEAIVWDGAGSHRDRGLRQQAEQRGIRLIEQPQHSPELNPAERIIEEIRAATEGR